MSSAPRASWRSFFDRILTIRQFMTIRSGSTIVAGLGLAGLGVALPTLLAADAPSSAPSSQPALPVSTVTVDPVDTLTLDRTFSGELRARRRSDLGFELAGLVRSLNVDEGEAVAAGQVLAELDTAQLAARRTELVAQRAAATAQLDELEAGPRAERIAAAEARVAELSANYEMEAREAGRVDALFGNQTATDKEQRDALSRREIAAARLDQAREELAELRNGTRTEQIAAQRARVDELAAAIARIDVDLGKCVLRAPFAGQIATRYVDEGAVMQPGAPVLDLIEAEGLEAHVGVPTDQAASLAVGGQQTILLSGRVLDATVRAILPALDRPTRTTTVVLTLRDALDPAAGLLPGRTVRLPLREKVRESGAWLPTAALLKGERGLWAVYAVVPSLDDPAALQVERRDVELLHSEIDRVFVRGVIQSGDRIVARGVHKLAPGQRVTIADNEADAN